MQIAVLVAAIFLAGTVVWLLVSRRRLAAHVERLGRFMHHGPFLAFMKDADGRYVYENRALVEHINRIRPGLTSLLGRTDREAFPSAEETSYVTNDRKVIECGQPMQFDEVSVDTDGTVRNWSTVKFPTMDCQQGPCIAGISIDVTERMASHRELARQRDILRRLIDVQESERRTLCHELHDGLMQFAIAAKMQLEAATSDVAVRPRLIDAAIACLDQGIADGRRVMRGVRPAPLDDLALTSALADLAEHTNRAGIAVEMNCGREIDALAASLQTTLYRLVQESLNNALKHSGADRATVEVQRDADVVRVRVRDYGSGCDVEKCRGRGFGLIGMNERVRLLGGTFRIDSRQGAGMEVVACLPIATSEPGVDDLTRLPHASPLEERESRSPGHRRHSVMDGRLESRHRQPMEDAGP